MLSTMDMEGGAARAAYRLYNGILDQNIETNMIVQNKKSDRFDILKSSNTKIWSDFRGTLDRIPTQYYRKRRKEIWSNNIVPTTGKVAGIFENLRSPYDLIHLHWINNGFIKLENLQWVKAPVIWTLHDMWPLTGGCHYSGECDKHYEHCGSCPLLVSSNKYDLSFYNFYRKKRIFENKKITIITPSNWLAEEARRSPIFNKSRIEVIPNGLDTGIYKPIKKIEAREIINLPLDKKLILFGAISATADKRKGYDILVSAIKKLVKDRKDVEVVIFGSSKPKNEIDFGCKVHYLGTIQDDITLSLIYSAADVMCVPSKQEAFGQTATESMACGTPVVAFDITGLKDIIDHKVNGYLAKPYSVEDFTEGLAWILETNFYDKLVNSGRKKIVEQFDIKLISNRHIKLYKDVIKESYL